MAPRERFNKQLAYLHEMCIRDRIISAARGGRASEAPGRETEIEGAEGVVVAAAPVGDHCAVKAPVPAQDIHEQVGVLVEMCIRDRCRTRWKLP